MGSPIRELNEEIDSGIREFEVKLNVGRSFWVVMELNGQGLHVSACLP